MKAIVLAAGRGSRLGPHTADQPKCLVKLFGRPLLNWAIDALRANGIDLVGIVGGYRCTALAGHGDRLFENPNWAETNMVASLRCAADWLRAEPCIVSYSDIFYQPSAVTALAAATAPLALTYDPNWLDLWSRRFAEPLADAETFRIDAHSRIREIGVRASTVTEIQGQYMGLLKITPESWSWIERLVDELEPSAAAKLDMTALLRRLIAAGHDIEGIPYSGYWGEVDSPDDLSIYEADANLRESLATAHSAAITFSPASDKP